MTPANLQASRFRLSRDRRWLGYMTLTPGVVTYTGATVRASTLDGRSDHLVLAARGAEGEGDHSNLPQALCRVGSE
jgi:hypothetical protein